MILQKNKSVLPCNSRRMRGGDMIFRFFYFYRLSDLGCPDFVGTAGFGCCIPPCYSVMIAKGWERILICLQG